MNHEKLRQFVALVEKWSAAINLVSRADIPHLWERHVEDSLLLLPHIPPGTASAIDLGSGAGFPGMVLAIASDIPFTLIESDRRKAAFLLDAARALAPLDRLLGLAAPHLAPGGICLFPKGKNWEKELTAAKSLWHMEAQALPAGAENCILKVSNLYAGQPG